MDIRVATWYSMSLIIPTTVLRAGPSIGCPSSAMIFQPFLNNNCQVSQEPLFSTLFKDRQTLTAMIMGIMGMMVMIAMVGTLRQECA